MMPIISEIQGTTDSIRPVIVDFQNAKFKHGEEDKLKSGLYKTPKNETVIGVQSDKMVYTGIVNNNDLYNNYIVINNKRTNKCRLIQVDFATLRPQLEKKQRDLLNISMSPRDKSIAELNKQFGSKRTIRMTEQTERLKMNIDTVKEDLQRTVTNIEIDTTEFGRPDQEVNDGIYRPKINREAARKEQVYKLTDLIPDKVMESLDQETGQIIENLDSLEELKFRPFVEFCVRKVMDMGLSDEDKQEKIKVLIYLHYLLHFFSVPSKNISRRFSVCNNKDVNFHILDNFSVVSSSNRLRPISMKTKALCYALVLAILVMDYEVDIEELSKDLKMGLNKVQEIGRVLALSQGGAGKKTMVLKLPLPAVVSVSAKRKRK